MRGCFPIHFNGFYVVTKFELPKVEDLKLTAIDFDPACSYLNGEGKYMPKLKKTLFKNCTIY